MKRPFPGRGGGDHRRGGPKPPERPPARGAGSERPTGQSSSRPAPTRPTPSHQGPDRQGTDRQRPPQHAAGAGERAERPRGGPATLRAPRPDDRRRPPDSDRPRAQPPQAEAAETPRGTVWLYGEHAVAAALGNPARRLRRLLLTEDAEASLRSRLPPPWPLPHERTERARIDRLLGNDVVHQGAALLADPLAVPLLATALERPGSVLVLDQVTDPRNIGAILRSAAAFGVAAVITQDRNAPHETGAMAKAASGALERVPLLRAVNIARTLVALKAAGCWVVGLDPGGGTLSGAALALRRVALVLGAEGDGLRRLTRETCDETAALAMPGGGDSLNVAVAAALALYELGRRPS